MVLDGLQHEATMMHISWEATRWPDDMPVDLVLPVMRQEMYWVRL